MNALNTKKDKSAQKMAQQEKQNASNLKLFFVIATRVEE